MIADVNREDGEESETSTKYSMSAEILVDEIDPEAAQNFTKVTDLEEERTVLRLYHKTLVHILKHFFYHRRTLFQRSLPPSVEGMPEGTL